MHIYDCEITHEHYKILKFCHGKHHVSYQKLQDKFCSLRRPYSYYRFQRDISFLRSHSFILQSCDDTNGSNHYQDNIYISSIGENTYSIIRTEKILFWKELLLSKWLDVVVAFVTAAITCANWSEIVNFFSKLFQQ